MKELRMKFVASCAICFSVSFCGRGQCERICAQKAAFHTGQQKEGELNHQTRTFSSFRKYLLYLFAVHFPHREREDVLIFLVVWGPNLPVICIRTNIGDVFSGGNIW